MLLGVRAVIAESFERIHRSNLVGMGVLPLQFPDGETAESLGLTGEETFAITGIAERARRRRRAARGDRRGRRQGVQRRACGSTRRRRSSTSATAGSCSTCCGSCGAVTDSASRRPAGSSRSTCDRRRADGSRDGLPFARRQRASRIRTLEGRAVLPHVRTRDHRGHGVGAPTARRSTARHSEQLVAPQRSRRVEPTQLSRDDPTARVARATGSSVAFVDAHGLHGSAGVDHAASSPVSAIASADQRASATAAATPQLRRATATASLRNPRAPLAAARRVELAGLDREQRLGAGARPAGWCGRCRSARAASARARRGSRGSRRPSRRRRAR